MAFLAVMSVGVFEAFVISQYGNQVIRLYSKIIPFMLVIEGIGFALGAASASMYSRSATKSAKLLVIFLSAGYAFIVGAPVAAVLYFLALIGGITAEKNIATFLQFYLPLASLIFANHAGLAILRASGNSKSCANALILSSLCHFLQLFMALNLDSQDTHILHALGIAYWISVATASLLLLRQMPGKARLLLSKINAARVRCFVTPMTVIAWKSATSNLMTPLGVFIALTLLASQSDDHAVAFALALKVEMFFLTGFYAYSSVIGPIAGERLGRAQPLSFRCFLPLLLLCSMVGIGLAILLALLQQYVGYALLNCSANSVELLRAYFLLVPLSYGAYGVVMLTQAVANGEGTPNIGLLLSFLRAIGFFLVLTLLFQSFEHGVFLAIMMANILASLLSLYLLSRSRTVPTKPNQTFIS